MKPLFVYLSVELFLNMIPVRKERGLEENQKGF